VKREETRGEVRDALIFGGWGRKGILREFKDKKLYQILIEKLKLF
jgi:hypothetical protein